MALGLAAGFGPGRTHGSVGVGFNGEVCCETKPSALLIRAARSCLQRVYRMGLNPENLLADRE